MDYKEEYQKALERAKKGLPIDEVFPELKESEDERIRKVLIHIVKGACSKYGVKYTWDEISEEKLLSYLEKQKEQKPESCDCSRDEESYTNGIHHVLMNPEAYGLIKQKPAEWSEEDEATAYLILKELEHDKKDSPGYSRHFARLIDWFTLRFKSLCPQPKQEQPEVDLEKFTDKIKTFQERYKYPEIVSIKGAMAFMARMFYQYPNAARQWYDSLPKATMD